MSNPQNDPNDSMENMPAVRARVPDHVAKGEISTGVIVVTGATEFVLDFVRDLPRPSTLVARVVLPHIVMVQFIEALAKNMQLFRQRYGEFPGTQQPAIQQLDTLQADTQQTQSPQETRQSPSAQSPPAATPSTDLPGTTSVQAGMHANPPAVPNPPQQQEPAPTQSPRTPKRQTPQEIYDELKLRDEILSGTYANAVMIGHGTYEFSFDFITNFYPQAAVSCRVYLAAGHIPRLLDSLKQSWEQLRPKFGYPPPNLP